MFYTDIQNLYGLDEPIDYGSGIEYANGLLELQSQSQNSNAGAIQIGLWLNGTTGCQDIVDGRLDEQIEQFMTYLQQQWCRPQRHVFVRVGYEFDNPDFRYSTTDQPALYAMAFRTLVQACPCRDQVDFVWHSWAASLTSAEELMAYYPGDDVVDWVGVSLFTQLYSNDNANTATATATTAPGASLDNTVRPVLDLARNVLNKPVMIAESTPYGGMDALADPWHDWFQRVLDLIQDYDIAMWSYIDCDWTRQPMWKYAGFGDTRLAGNTTVLKLWQKHVFQNPRFVYQSDAGPLFEQCHRREHEHGHHEDHHDHHHEHGHRHEHKIQFPLPRADLTATGSQQPLTLPVYWMVAIGIAFLAILFQYLCKAPSAADNRYITRDVLPDESDEKADTNPDRIDYGTMEEK